MQYSQQVRSVSFSPCGDVFAAGLKDGTVKITYFKKNDYIIIQHNHLVSSISFSPDCNMVATGSWDNTAKITDLKTGETLHTFHEANKITTVRFSYDGSMLALGSENILKVINLKNIKLNDIE